ncbi:arginine--tRNA ligase [Mesosutterella sp. AGMB02718]|uniref:Arginine--tRNA ligase n=1 Tax=Mesosutterella faecium TaxID=2925194 RepID=A0ABT7IN71_9BURK|nr:arginine--tRNA ligase [Mesosutterella sp. AGMB02718]MDL2058776.1 arginine--tRNA ligase [Mesosutterella sp. AGMB02718]
MLDQQKQELTELFQRALASIGAGALPVVLERPKVASHGDVACTVALQSAKVLHKAPRQIAEMIVSALRSDPEFPRLLSSVEIAGPGFINMRLANSAQQEIIKTILAQKEKFGTNNSKAGQSVIIEYVSANPTGPLHLGHARQGALGDVLSNILKTQGWKVTREYYYNDAGAQINNLTVSVQLRGRELLGEKIDFPEKGYHGEYIIDIARDYLARRPVTSSGATITPDGNLENEQLVRKYAVAYLRNEQDADLKKLGVEFDNYYLESSLYSDGLVKEAVDAIIASGHTYEKDNALWLRTTDFSKEDLGGLVDDKDRVMKKQDGFYTYFVPDVAYHLTKFRRGFSRAINIQGSDHHGTRARLRAGIQAASRQLGLNVPKVFPEWLLHKMLLVMKDGKEVKMSKRSGSYVTLSDLVNWVGKDAARYFLVSRKADAEFTFDINLAVSKSDENPVYYLQYAYARICSIFRQAEEKGFSVPSTEEMGRLDLSCLTAKDEIDLINRLSDYSNTLSSIAESLSPHLLCFYLRDLAASFHAFYNAERVLTEDAVTRNGRLALLAAVRQVLGNGLSLLGISAPEKM